MIAIASFEDRIDACSRTPTEPGSSGSPVFETENSEVVGLHHAHTEITPQINTVSGTAYSANEAISILALVTASWPTPAGASTVTATRSSLGIAPVALRVGTVRRGPTSIIAVPETITAARS